MTKSNTAELPGADLLFGSHVNKADVGQNEKPTTEPVSEEKTTKNNIPVKIKSVYRNEPVKFTFYFDPQLLEDLEVAKFRLRMEKRIKVSKSDIVNAAVKYCMKDMTFLERLVRGEIK